MGERITYDREKEKKHKNYNLDNTKSLRYKYKDTYKSNESTKNQQKHNQRRSRSFTPLLTQKQNRILKLDREDTRVFYIPTKILFPIQNQ